MKNCFIAMMVWCSCAFSEGLLDQQILDFAKIDTTQFPEYNIDDWKGIENLCKPFKNSIELIPYFDYLCTRFSIEKAVQTGSWDTETSKYLSLQCLELSSIECDSMRFEKAMKERYSNVNLSFGVAPEMLAKILPHLKGERIFFYSNIQLHGARQLMEQIKILSQTHHDNCLIVINACKVPGREEILYDRNGAFPCSYISLKKVLSKVFSSYVYQFVIPQSGEEAKLVIIPKKWIKELN